jgi:hypothetical protein
MLSAIQSRMLKRIFGPKRNEVTEGWGKLHNEELLNLYSLTIIITMIKPKRMKWAGHVAQIGRKRRMHIGYWWESQKERNHLEDQDVGGRVI